MEYLLYKSCSLNILKLVMNKAESKESFTPFVMPVFEFFCQNNSICIYF